ncbi:MAG: hypothetical protein QM692_23610 [Thermomicrobiales bacterium]
MSTAFHADTASWADFFTLLGGAAAALLGLLFVALSLRLGIFRQHRSDIQDSAALAFASLLVAIGVAVLMVAPNRDRGSTALILVLVAVAGLTAEAWVWRVMRRLVATARRPEPLTHGAAEWLGRHGLSNLGLLIAAWLIWIGHVHGLGMLAFTEAYLLASGAVSTWLLLAHTANDPVDPDA